MKPSRGAPTYIRVQETGEIWRYSWVDFYAQPSRYICPEGPIKEVPANAEIIEVPKDRCVLL